MTLNRTIFYTLALFTAILQSVFGTLAGFINGNSPCLRVFGKLAGALSIVTWIWISILMNYNRRPQSTHPLCRSYAHFVSFSIFGVAWLAIGIMLATQMPWECKSKTLWCAAASFSSALAFCTSLFSIIAAHHIYRSAACSGAGLVVNIDYASKRELTLDV